MTTRARSVAFRRGRFVMEKRDAKKGLATLCIGGGMGMALCVERD